MYFKFEYVVMAKNTNVQSKITTHAEKPAQNAALYYSVLRNCYRSLVYWEGKAGAAGTSFHVARK
jgi:hypothetical protein